MKKISGPFTLLDFLLIPCFGVLLIVLGSFLDLSFTKAIYIGENGYSTLIELIGKLPMYLFIAIPGVLFFLSFYRDTRKPLAYGSYAAWLLPLASGVLYGYDDLSARLGTLGGIALGIVIVGGICVGFFFLLWKKSTDKFLDAALIMLISAAVTFLIAYFLKQGADRARYTFVVANGEEYFTPWWKYGQGFYSQFAETTEHRLFESLPSGHAAGAATLALLPYLLDIFPEPTKKWTVWLKRLSGIIAFVFVLLVCLGRLLDGSHYLSDLGFGILVGSIPAILCAAFIPTFGKPLPKKDREEEKEIRDE